MGDFMARAETSTVNDRKIWEKIALSSVDVYKPKVVMTRTKSSPRRVHSINHGPLDLMAEVFRSILVPAKEFPLKIDNSRWVWLISERSLGAPG